MPGGRLRSGAGHPVASIGPCRASTPRGKNGLATGNQRAAENSVRGSSSNTTERDAEAKYSSIAA